MAKGKNVMAVVVGAVTGMILISAGEYIMQLLYPMPQGLDMNNHADMIMYVKQLTNAAFVFLMINYTIGSFGGGIVATLLSQREKPLSAVIVGAILTLGGLFNVLSLPHPLWFTISNLFIYIPMAYAGFRVMARKSSVS